MTENETTTPDPHADPTSLDRRTRRSRRLRWAVPVVAAAGVAAVTAGAVVAPALAGATDGPLPQLSAQQLLTRVGSAAPQPLSGTVVETADLGFPALPGSGSSTSLTSLISGSHTLRVWYGSDSAQRLAVQGDLAETDVVRNGNQAWIWIWTSSSNTAQKLLLPAAGASTTKPEAGATAEQLTPSAAATRALAAVQPSTSISVDPTVKVAGRQAYQLVLRPQTAGSLVDRVTIAVDGATSIPLRVQVYAVGHADPAFATGFTSLTVAAPDASVFRFDPPAGAKVTTKDLSSAMAGAHGPDSPQQPEGTGPKPTVVGSGWSSIVSIPGVNLSAVTKSVQGSAGQGSAGRGGAHDTLATLTRAATPVSGSFGTGRVLQTRLFSVLLLDDGRAFVGAVSPAALEQAAAR